MIVIRHFGQALPPLLRRGLENKINMSRDIIEKIKKIKTHSGQVNPDHVWVTKNREQMMMQVKNTVPETKPKFNMEMIWQGIGVLVPSKVVYNFVRPVAVFSLIAVVVTSGWIASVSATQDSLPGDIGYGVKMATEKTQEIVVKITSAEDKEAAMHMEFASRRAEEVKKVSADKNDMEAPAKAKVAVDKMEKSIQAANENIKNVAETQLEKVVSVSKDVAERSKEIKESLKKAEEDNQEVDVENAKKITNEINLTALENVVQKKQEGKIDISEEEIMGLLSDQIEIIIGDADFVKEKAEKVNREAVDEETAKTSVSVAEDVEEDSVEVLIVEGEVNVEENKEDVFVTTTVEQMIEKTNKTVEESNEKTEKDLTEAKSLVENNQLLEAMQMIREVSQNTQETGLVVKETQKIVNVVKEQAEIAGRVVEEESLEDMTTTTLVIPEVFESTTTASSSEIENVEQNQNVNIEKNVSSTVESNIIEEVEE